MKRERKNQTIGQSPTGCGLPVPGTPGKSNRFSSWFRRGEGFTGLDLAGSINGDVK
jgi:hypothetical protein